jgi:GntR family transcriptional regulator/MocR family aminotransferase
MRLRYRDRRDHLLRRLAADVPAVTTSGVAAGLQTLVHLPPGGPTAADVAAAAATRGLAVASLGDHHWHIAGSRPEALVVGFGTPAAHAFHTTVGVLIDVLADSLARAGVEKSGFPSGRGVVD